MTRKQALQKARTLLCTYDHPQADRREREEIAAKLAELAADLPLTAWTEAAIFDAVDSWIEENGRLPTTRDLARRGLPPIPVLKRRFGLTGREFLDRFYPAPPERRCSGRYGDKTAAEWLEAFAAEYRRVGPCAARRYNRRRSPGTPAWHTLARITGTGTWRGLLAACGLPLHREAAKGAPRPAAGLTVSRRVDADRALAATATARK